MDIIERYDGKFVLITGLWATDEIVFDTFQEADTERSRRLNNMPITDQIDRRTAAASEIVVHDLYLEILPEFADLYAKIVALRDMASINDLDDQLVAAAEAGIDIHGYPPAHIQAANVIFDALMAFVSTPIPVSLDGTKMTPKQLILKRVVPSTKN
jgi:hypothetical protein